MADGDPPSGLMAFFLNLIFSLAFAGAVGGAVQLWRVQLDAARRDGMQALAARRGWALTVTGERLGRAGTLRLAPRGGLPWLAEARPRDGRPGGPVTEYEANEPLWAEGTLILVPMDPRKPSPREAEEAPREPAPLPDLQRERALRDHLGEDIARLASQMAPVSAPDGVMALTAGDPSLRLNLNDLAQAMRDFVPVASGPRGRPVLILSPEGMRLRLGHTVKRPDQMERFLDLAFKLSRLIGP